MSEIALQHKPDGPKVDTSVVKVCAEFAPVGQMGQKYLAACIRMCTVTVSVCPSRCCVTLPCSQFRKLRLIPLLPVVHYSDAYV